MSVLQTTGQLYLDALKDAGRGFSRSLVALGFLVLSGLAMVFVTGGLGGAGFAGGMFVGFFQCFLIGIYLRLIEIALFQKRTLRMVDIQENLGSYFMETLSMGFAVSLPTLVLGFTAPQVVPFWVLAASLLFNAGVEVIYQDASARDFVGGLQRALEFMSENWPEWLGAHLPIFFGIGGLMLFFGTPFSVVLASSVSRIYSPFYGFQTVNTVAALLLQGGPMGIAATVALVGFNHFVMLFRGALYRQLSGSSRRSREFRQRQQRR